MSFFRAAAAVIFLETTVGKWFSKAADKLTLVFDEVKGEFINQALGRIKGNALQLDLLALKQAKNSDDNEDWIIQL